MLVVMGTRWLQKSESGHSRLHDPQDWVRIEVETALARNIRVIPVLVADADMPTAADLPEGLAGLALRQKFEMSDRHWEQDLDLLIEELSKVSGIQPVARGSLEPQTAAKKMTSKEATSPSPQRENIRPGIKRAALAAGALSAAVLGALGLFEWSEPTRKGASPDEPAANGSRSKASARSGDLDLKRLAGKWIKQDDRSLVVMTPQGQNMGMEWRTGESHETRQGEGIGHPENRTLVVSMTTRNFGSGDGTCELHDSDERWTCTMNFERPNKPTAPFDLARY